MWRRLGAPSVALVGATLFTKVFAQEQQTGLWIWGDNRQKLFSPEAAATVRTPQHIPWFDGKILRDVALSSEVVLAVMKNGDLVEYTAHNGPKVVLKGVKSVAVTGNTSVALKKNGQLWAWSTNERPERIQSSSSLGWFEKITDFSVGEHHFAALSNKGNVFTSLLTPVTKHDGEIGLASFSAFDVPPPARKLFQVGLLDKPVAQVACGSSHTIFLMRDGEVWGCGSNKNGQLVLPFSYRNLQVSVPTRLGRPPLTNIDYVAAGGETSYFRRDDGEVFAAGNGMHGQFGTGSLAHCQTTPLRIPAFSGLREFDESIGKIVPIKLAALSAGATHSFGRLSNGDWYIWGSSECGQLGTGKLAKILKPVPLRDTNLRGIYGNKYVAGDGVSAIYTCA